MSATCTQDGETSNIVVWGHQFTWTPEHLTAEKMEPLKFTYDSLADECLLRINDLVPQKAVDLHSEKPDDSGKRKVAPPIRRDYYELLKENSSKDGKLNQLWNEVNTIPEWVDWDQIERGQDVFYRYGGPALTALAYQSLLGGMGAHRVVETLTRTGGFSIRVAKRRLYETTQHVLQVTKSLESIQPGGAGHISSIKVRLLHAQVRQHILALEKSRPGYYDVEEYGIPINDIDCMGTIISFSATLIWLGFPRQGIWLREQEIADYMALWRLVAYYMGTPTDHFETPAKAKRLMESVLVAEINPSETSRILANNIILCLQNQAPTYASNEFLTAGARWLIGDDLGDELALSRPGLYYKALFAGQCLFFMALCYGYRTVDSWDRRKIKALKKIFYAVIVENKEHGLGGETNFEFKYIPSFYTKTRAGNHDGKAPTQKGVERRNLRTLLIAGAVSMGFTWCFFKIARSAFRLF